MKPILLLSSILAALGTAACKQSKADESSPAAAASAASDPSAAPAPPVAANPQTATAGPTVEISLGSLGAQMLYDTTKLTVKAGSRVHLQFTNHGTSPLLPHNWTLVNPGKEAAVAAAGLQAGEPTGYITPGPDVLAHTPLAAPGKTVEVAFDAPPVGKYPYICTTPGHYVMMKGELEVTP